MQAQSTVGRGVIRIDLGTTASNRAVNDAVGSDGLLLLPAVVEDLEHAKAEKEVDDEGSDEADDEPGLRTVAAVLFARIFDPPVGREHHDEDDDERDCAHELHY
eukprot:CAMPEP_0185579418 /NCGR_PEP_ID=MMETSP0434-20130131/14705_1 /TAXON_ID=626734 ORGANISM="Favella taraikaensis, Strain Fe Narragansett Bay" /NCGR_SAMPLE_ID=MMETSP0434 /ASSEMBLY_ACC=CAM_ASM_000379 /LENGTH=103 /DNA_ID=CAMNT_0028197441 /DNA_START=132 /DNA_END=444 /DNA_ORIENTATION=-